MFLFFPGFGKLFFKTDHEGYYNDVLELMKRIEGFKVVYNTNDLHNDPLGKDNIKTEYCKNNNIKLLRIPYYDFNNIEKILEKILLT